MALQTTSTAAAAECGCDTCTKAVTGDLTQLTSEDVADYCAWGYKNDVKCIQDCAKTRCTGFTTKEDQEKCLEQCAESCGDKKAHPWWWWALVAFGIILLIVIVFSMMGGRGQTQDVIVAGAPTTYYV